MPHVMKIRLIRNNELHEIIMEEKSYVVIPPPGQRIQEIIASAETPQEAAQLIQQEGLII